VTTLELFFDLVFVFALTQVTALVAGDLTARGCLRGLVLLGLLWWAWTAFAWLGNVARADEGAVRAALVGSMGLLFVFALAVPGAWADQGGSPSAALVLAVTYTLVRYLHVSVYAVAAGQDRELRRQVTRLALVGLAPASALIVGAIVGGPWQTTLWALGLVVDYGGVYLAGSEGWRVRSAGHFAERHGLIVLIALGESLVAIGVGVADLPLTWWVIAAATAGVSVVVALWWTYFDVGALVAERRLEQAEGDERTRLARDSFTYLHFPMIVGIVALAVGLKKTLTQVADSGAYQLADPLKPIPAALLTGGIALYLLAHVAFRRRNVGSWNLMRVGVALALVAATPAAREVPAIVSVSVVAIVLVGLVGAEWVRYREVRRRVRG